MRLNLTSFCSGYSQTACIAVAGPGDRAVAQALNLQVIAEGVESKKEMLF